MRKDNSPVRSYAKSNQQLLGAFETYLISLNRSIPTRRAYLDSAERLVEVLGSKDVIEADRNDIRALQSQLLAKGVTANSIRLHIGGIRAFSKFLRLAGLTSHDPTLLLAHRKLTVTRAAGANGSRNRALDRCQQTPLERAIIEVLYSTGVRISELTALRVENITFSEPGVIRVNRGKGDKDEMLFRKPGLRQRFGSTSTAVDGFLFEAPARVGEFFARWRSWYARFYDERSSAKFASGKSAIFRKPRRGQSSKPKGRDSGIPPASRASLQCEVNPPASEAPGIPGTCGRRPPTRL